MNILTFDIGTSAVKTSLFSESLALLASSIIEYVLDAKDGRVEADPEIYLNAMKKCLMLLPTELLQQIGAVGLTSQGETLIPVDLNGNPLCPSIIWLDDRAGEQARQIRNAIEQDVFRVHTGLPGIDGALPLSKILWLKQTSPELYARTHKFLLVEDYVIYRLTGEYVTEKSIQSSSGYFDLVQDTWWYEGLAQAGLNADKLPTLLEPGSIAGYITTLAAGEFGLPPCTLVCTGAMDQTAAALAAGCIMPGKMVETTGSALVAAACITEEARGKTQALTVYRHAIPGVYLALGIGNSGGLALKWLKEQWLSLAASYDQLAEVAKQAPPGSEGLIFLPFLCGSVQPVNAPGAQAAFVGATLATTQSHMIRSVFEGVAFLLDDLLRTIEETGISVTEITSLGGGSKSAFWQQMKADVCQRHFRTILTSEAASWGAAWLAAKALGLSSSRLLPEGQEAQSWCPSQQATLYQSAKARYQQAYRTILPMYLQEE